MRYATARAFAQALTARLKHRAEYEGVDVDRLRKRVAFERFLVRLFAHEPSRWLIKGGYALELRLGDRARATKDIDLNLPPPPSEDLLEELQEATELDFGDFFVFRVGRPRPQTTGPPLGGYRFTLEAHLAGRLFAAFPLDVGQGDEPLGETEWQEGLEDLDFAGIPRARLTVYPLADQFAEKLHALTRLRENPSRVKDLVDLMLILEALGELLPTKDRMLRTIEATFDRYGTHELPDPLPPPPEEWRRPFEAAARELRLQTNEIGLAHRKLGEYVSGLGYSL